MHFSGAEALQAAVGSDLGCSDWLPVELDRIRRFADATYDHQWIHVDEERARAGPFGGPIAHGYLTLALVNAFLPQLISVPSARTDRSKRTSSSRAPGRYRGWV